MSDDSDQSTEERARGILTHDDRLYLYDKCNLTVKEEQDTRRRIQQRVENALLDLELLWELLPEDDLEQVFYPNNVEKRKKLRAASQYGIALLLVGLSMNRDPHGSRISDSIEQAIFTTDSVAAVDVSIDREDVPEGDALIAKIDDKETRSNELRERLAQQELSEKKRAEIERQLEKVQTHWYYLYEKALFDDSVDPEEFVSIPVLGGDRLSAEDVAKEREYVEASPLVRHPLPTIVDISHSSEQTDESS